MCHEPPRYTRHEIMANNGVWPRTMTKLMARGPNFFKSWAVSGAAFGVTGSLLVVYLTDWKAVASYIPFYGGKFKE